MPGVDLEDQPEVALPRRHALADVGAHAGRHLDAHLGPLLAQRRQPRRQDVGADRLDGGDHQSGLDLRRHAGELGGELAGQRQDPPRVGQERLARARERHAFPLRAFAEELGAQRPFEGNQRLRHRRLRHAEAARGARVAARFDDRHEDAQVAELELGPHRLIFLPSPPDGSRVHGQKVAIAMPTAEGIRVKISAAPSDRLAFVDALRGFALLGVFWANLLIFSGIEYMSASQRTAAFPSRLDAFAYGFERFFIENKFMGLFSTLFGVSFWLFLSRAQRPRRVRRHCSSTGGSSGSSRSGSLHGWLLWCLRHPPLLRALGGASPALRGRAAAAPAPRRARGERPLAGARRRGCGAAMPPPARGAPTCDAIALAAFSHGSYRDVLAANWRYDWYLTLSIGQIDYQVAIFGRLLLGLWIARTLDLGDLARHRALLRRVLLVGGLAGLAGSTVFAGRSVRRT